MRACLLLCVVSLTSASAQSTLRTSGSESQVSLSGHREVESGGELVLHAGAIGAPGGIRNADSAEWQDSVPLALGVKLIARDASGQTYEVVVRSIEETAVSLDISALRKEPLRKGPHYGTFKMTHWSINGSAAEPTVPMLTLKPEGEYTFGGAKGRWSFDGTGVNLLGPYAHWGCAKLRANGDELVFDYTRGVAHFEVVLTREADPPAQALR